MQVVYAASAVSARVEAGVHVVVTADENDAVRAAFGHSHAIGGTGYAQVASGVMEVRAAERPARRRGMRILVDRGDGVTVAVAIGCQVAEPHRPTCVIVEARGFARAAAQLLDAATHGVALVVVVLDPERRLDLRGFAAAIGAEAHVGADALPRALQRASRLQIVAVQPSDAPSAAPYTM